VTLPAEARDRYIVAFDEAAGGKGRPSWLRRLREEAKERFLADGFPEARHEDWKYTNVAGIAERRFEPPPRDDDGLSPSGVAGLLPGEDAGNVLVFANGRYREDLSVRRPLPPGVHLGSLSDALSGKGDALVPYFSRAPANAFADLNTMLMEDGAFLHVGKGVEVPEPIHLLFLTCGGGRPSMVHPRNVIVAGEGSRVTVVERYAGLSDAGCLVNSVTDIATARCATVAHYRLQEDGPDAFHIASLRARQGTGSRFAAHSFSLGARLSRSDVHAVLDGEEAACLLEKRVQPSVEPHGGGDARAAHGLDHRVGVGQRGRDGLLEVEVLARGGRGDRKLGVEMGGDADDDGVDVRPGQEVFGPLAHRCPQRARDPRPGARVGVRGADEGRARDAANRASVNPVRHASAPDQPEPHREPAPREA